MQNSSRAGLDVGSVVAGTYTIEALIGSGGMGAVWRAGHSRLPGKKVAIKTLHAEMADPETLARFRHEAEIASRLGHPNIVQVHDFDTLPDGTPYLVLEYLRGETLAHRLRNGPIPLDQALSIVRQIGSALAAAHREGIIHRDLKPGNIFLVPTEVDGREMEIAKLLDFGISKMRGSQTVKTQESSLLGTPQYMAPEQAKGDHSTVDERTDIFALGAILYEMLAGRPAFYGESIPEVVFKVVYEKPAALQQVAPSIPGQITNAVEQAMAKPAGDRFPSVNGFIEALTGEPLQTIRGGSTPQLEAKVPASARAKSPVVLTQVGVPSQAPRAEPVGRNTPTEESLGDAVPAIKTTADVRDRPDVEARSVSPSQGGAWKPEADVKSVTPSQIAHFHPEDVKSLGVAATMHSHDRIDVRGTALDGGAGQPAPVPRETDPAELKAEAVANNADSESRRARSDSARPADSVPAAADRAVAKSVPPDAGRRHPQADVLTVRSPEPEPPAKSRAWLVVIPIAMIAAAGAMYLAMTSRSSTTAGSDAQMAQIGAADAAQAHVTADAAEAMPDAAIAVAHVDAGVTAHDAPVVAKHTDAAGQQSVTEPAKPEGDPDLEQKLEQAEAALHAKQYPAAIKLADEVLHSQGAGLGQKNHAHGIEGEIACLLEDVGAANTQLRSLTRGAKAAARIRRACKDTGHELGP